MTPRLLAYLRMLLGDLHDAEDVLQELFLRFLARGPLPHTDDARRWLFHVGRNLGLKALRTNQRRERRERLHPQPAPCEDPASSLEKRESLARIQNCLDALEPDLRELVFLKIVEQLSYRDIEQQTGVPRSTAALRVQDGLARLSGCFHGS